MMLCPFRKMTIIHKGNIVDKTIEEFAECCKKECPYYSDYGGYREQDGELERVCIDRCTKVELEIMGGTK